MYIYIYGAGIDGGCAKSILEEKYSLQIEGFIDSFKEGEFKGKRIFKMEEVPLDAVIVVAVTNSHKVTSIYNALREKGYYKLYWYFRKNGEYDRTEDFFLDECINMMDWGSLVLPYIDFHISDKCNLNCKGCDHFSPLFNSIGKNFDQKIQDIYVLKQKFTNISQITILGGEPLLCDEIDKYIIAMRNAFPNANIRLLTNGLLLPTLSRELYSVIRDNNIIVSISEYDPTHRMIDQIEETLKRNRVKYFIFENDTRKMFKKPVSIVKNSKYPRKCLSVGCYIVAEGKIAKCPTLMYISRFNEYFNQNLPDDGIIDLNGKMTGKAILDQLEQEVPLCKHCIDCNINWEVCGREISLEDFAVLD